MGVRPTSDRSNAAGPDAPIPDATARPTDLPAELPPEMGRHRPRNLPKLSFDRVLSDLADARFCPVNHGNILEDERFPRLRADESIASPEAHQPVLLMGEARLAVVDICVHRINDNRSKMRKLSALIQRNAVGSNERIAEASVAGFWVVDSPSDLRSTLNVPGAQILVAVDRSHRLMGMYIYHLGQRGAPGENPVPGHFAPVDEKLIRAARDSGHISDGTRFGVGHMVVVDRVTQLSPEEGGAGIRRRDVLTAFHACMISEARREGVDSLIGYVRAHPHNTASKAHNDFGWQELPGCTFTFRDYLHPISQPVDVVNQVLRLDVWAPHQDRILEEARSMAHISFLDFDPHY